MRFDHPFDVSYAVTIWQPWVSAIVEGLKGAETRSRSAPLRHIGTRIGLHAGKHRIPVDHPVWDLFPPAERLLAHELPYGALVATAVLVDCTQSFGMQLLDGESVYYVRRGPQGAGWYRDDGLGDYNHGRWVWFLDDVRKLDKPIPMRGRQGFWPLDPPIRIEP